MKILGILGSPRKGGNSDILLEEALRGAREAGAETEKIVLDALEIRGCRDCKGCNETGRCVIEDDMPQIHEKILDAQGILHSVPVYFYSMTAQMKAYLDRWCAFFDGDWELHTQYVPKFQGKKVAIIAVCGAADPEMTEPTIDPFRRTVEFQSDLLEWGGALAVPSVSDKGDVQHNKQALEEAYKLGKTLVSQLE